VAIIALFAAPGCDSVAPAQTATGTSTTTANAAQTASNTRTDAAIAPNSDRPKLIYVHDAMCGWCYGFSPTIQAAHERWKADVDFEIVNGGLATGARAVPVAQTRDYIRGALQKVEAHAGVEFGEGFHELMNDGTYVYDSVPPARAIVTMRAQRPELAIPFAADVQRALFFHGQPLDAAATYRTILDSPRYRSVDVEEFLEAWRADSSLEAARADFERSRALGVRSFPTLILEDDEGRQVLPGTALTERGLDRVLARATP
jgi:putative protein-disulfide isomerase